MPVREWAGRMLLRAPEPLRSLRNAPLIGGLIHRFSHSMVPTDEKIWAQVESGPAKGIWLRLNPRTGQHYLRGEGETATQNVLVEQLRPGIPCETYSPSADRDSRAILESLGHIIEPVDSIHFFAFGTKGIPGVPQC